MSARGSQGKCEIVNESGCRIGSRDPMCRHKEPHRVLVCLNAVDRCYLLNLKIFAAYPPLYFRNRHRL